MAPNFHQLESLGELGIQQCIEVAFPIAFGKDIECGPVPGPVTARVAQAERDPYWAVHCDAATEYINGAFADVRKAVADDFRGDKARFGVGDDVHIRARITGAA